MSDGPWNAARAAWGNGPLPEQTASPQQDAAAEASLLTEGQQALALRLALIAGALVFIVLVGVAVVIYPAFRASRINPVNILRRE